MTERLKRWESPRYKGRNIKGKGGSARSRQLRKQQQALRNKLKNQKNGNLSSHFLLFIFIILDIRTNSQPYLMM
ncbi:MAG: hypothetical protein QNJ68_14475 [Microcoleaceae cyanobacterium MO_207.B10]|nr:hypothetical protein [Microcoleaceae cyanobacterium MO_207.B10]